jgi:transcription elongation factor GreA
MMQKHPMTVEGEITLKNELHRLKSIERPRIIEAIATARAHGDLKENAEYHAAREEQSFMEGRIQDLEAKLSLAQVVDPSKLPNTGKVVFGVTVTLCHVETNAETTYQIVGEDEADIKSHKISYSSPIARALIGKFIDDTVVVKTPGGDVEYEIISVDYGA